jgi:UDP-N-acetyl-D-glucosamine dehydrogenase
MNVTVIGMGKIGLPLAVNFARNGARVTGLDVQEKVVNQINSGIEPFPGEKDLDIYLEECVADGSLVATLDKKAGISSAEILVVCIPLIIDSNGDPDFNNIDDLAKDIGLNLSVGSLVCFETTLPVGTTRNRFTVAVEAASGLKVGLDFYVVFSPERVLTGRVFQDLRKYPKLVGGVTDECTKRGVEFYTSVLQFDPRPDLHRPNGVWAMKNAEAAEFAKIAETTYRDVNIGLANEFSVYANSMGVDILEVIEASNSQPYSHIHTPGISVGGHCIPVYPRFYMWENSESQIVAAARLRNLDMPRRAVHQIKDEFGNLNGLKIAVLGITYRAGVKEAAFSGALDLLKYLSQESATVFGLDPFYDEREIVSFGFNGVADLGEMDGVIIHTDHSEFSALDFERFENLKFVYDGRRSNTQVKSSKTIKYLTY